MGFCPFNFLTICVLKFEILITSDLLKFIISENIKFKLIFSGIIYISSVIAFKAGNSFPSIYSSKAPPAVEI